MNSGSLYLVSARKLFAAYKSLADKAFGQVSESLINFKPDPESNSLALIVKHMHGNMISRWTDFLTRDGEKENRDRDQEFEGMLKNKKEMLDLWEAGWARLFETLNALTEEDLQRTVYIRKESHAVIEAINRQLAHYSYHVGQIVFLSKMISGKEWKSLSIPKGKSEDFNREKSGQ